MEPKIEVEVIGAGGPKIKRLSLPVLLIWGDRTIDCDRANILSIPWAFVAKGRTLTLRDIDEKDFRVESDFTMDIRGSVRFARKPKEISVEDLRNSNPNEKKS